MSQNTFCMAGGVARNPLVRLAKPITATIGANEHIAIVGPNGGGKSLFVDTLIGKYPLREGTLQYDFSPSATQTVYDNVKYIAFRDTYGATDANYYYQQRWNAHDQDETPDVREMLGEIKDEQLKNELFELFRIEPLLDKKIILLSSGELRKFQLTKTLLTAPRVLIMDNPFIGLDAPTRELLFSLLERLTKMSSVQIILVLSMMDDIPSFITHVIPVDKMEVFSKMEREAYLTAFRNRDTTTSFDELQKRIIDLPYDGNNYDSDEVVKLNKVSIRYGDRTILNELDWTVHRGEKWALSGENGAGKSTLIKILLGFLKYDRGQIKVGGVELRDLCLDKFYDKIVYLSQDSPIFDGTIRENILFDRNVPDDEIMMALEKVNLSCLVRDSAKGLDTQIGEKGTRLSGGEKQRLALARLWFEDPELVILDEATSALDNLTEEAVMQEVLDRLKDQTMIVIAHRLNFIAAFDKIIVFRNSKITSQGTFEELMKSDPYFAELYHTSSQI